MRRRTILSALPVSLAATAVATGCGSGSAAGQKTTEITYWSNWKQGESQQKVISQAIDDFTARTGIKVDVQWQGRAVTQKLVPALNTNKVPDLVDGSFAKLAPVVADTQQAADLTSVYGEKVEDSTVSEVIPKQYHAELTGSGGHPWMVPYLVSSVGVWFDRARHADLVSDAPATWDDFVARLDTLKKAGKTPLAADGDISGYNAYWFNNLYLRETEVGGFSKLASDKSGAGWDAPEALSAARKVEQIVKGGYLIRGYGASKWPAQQQAWATGKAALLLNGTWIPTETASYASKGFEYASFPFPAVTSDGPAIARADFTGFAIPRKSKHQKEAGQLAALLLDKKYQDLMGSQAKSLPVRSDATTPPEQASTAKALQQADAVYQQNDGVTFPGYVEKVFWPLDDQLFLGKISAQQFVAKMKSAQAAYWKDKA